MSAQMDEEEMENFMKLVDESGEISKHDLIIQVIVNLQLNLVQVNKIEHLSLRTSWTKPIIIHFVRPSSQVSGAAIWI